MTERQMLDLFLALTERTIPCGSEEMLRGFFPSDATEDRHGNIFVSIGESRVAFTSHLDTVGGNESQLVSHNVDGSFVHTDGKTILGADDKAGVAIMLGMIQDKVPGRYCFFAGEECGAVGSRGALEDGAIKDIDFMISLDRAGYSDLIDTQGGLGGTSKAFEASLLAELERQGLYYAATTGVFTDSLIFFGEIPECTNLSVGYFGHHTNAERQNWRFLHRLYLALCGIDYGKLVAERTPVWYDERASYGGLYGHRGLDSFDDIYGWDSYAELSPSGDTRMGREWDRRYGHAGPERYLSAIKIDNGDSLLHACASVEDMRLCIVADTVFLPQEETVVTLGELREKMLWSRMDECWTYTAGGNKCLLSNGDCVYEDDSIWLLAIEAMSLLVEDEMLAIATDYDDTTGEQCICCVGTSTDFLSTDFLSTESDYLSAARQDSVIDEGDILPVGELPRDTERLQEIAVAVRAPETDNLLWVVGSAWHYIQEEVYGN